MRRVLRAFRLHACYEKFGLNLAKSGIIGDSGARNLTRMGALNLIKRKENAKNNNITNAEFLLGKSEDVIKKLISQNVKLDAVIVDPPRKGCEESFLRDLAAMDIEKIVYVSCNPATLARDMEIMRGLGYKLGAVQPVDMFPGTYHVEAVSLLVKE